MKIELFPHQYKFVTSGTKVTCLCAGRGAGKSLIAAWKVVQELRNGRSGLIIAPIFDDLSSVMIPYVIEFLDKSKTKYEHNQSKHFIKTKNAICYYRSAETDRGIRKELVMVVD